MNIMTEYIICILVTLGLVALLILMRYIAITCYLNKHSEAIRFINTLNKKYLNKVIYKKYIKVDLPTLQKFKTYDPAAALMANMNKEYVSASLYDFITDNDRPGFIDKRDIEGIYVLLARGICKKEKKKFKDLKKPILIEWSYTSPAGRNHYSHHERFSVNSIYYFYREEVIDGGAPSKKIPIRPKMKEQKVATSARVKSVRQPKGGYLPINQFIMNKISSDEILAKEENVHCSLLGLAVDYLTRFMLAGDLEEAFEVSLKGASVIGENRAAIEFLSTIKGLDDQSIVSAIRLSGYDVCYRASPLRYKPVEDILPDVDTINNVRIMVKRSLAFFIEYGPVVCDGFVIEDESAAFIRNGEGDYLTGNALWDFKVSKTKPTKENTLQLLVYFLMGKRSGKREFENTEYVGIFNPRLNCVYMHKVSEIDKSIIKDVENDVIGY